MNNQYLAVRTYFYKSTSTPQGLIGCGSIGEKWDGMDLQQRLIQNDTEWEHEYW